MKTNDLEKNDPSMMGPGTKLYKVVPIVAIYENDKEILIHAEMPGVKKEDLVINFDNGVLTLSGSRVMTRADVIEWEDIHDVEYYRIFSVPQTIDVEKVQAELKDGILVVCLPKSETKEPEIIEISAD